MPEMLSSRMLRREAEDAQRKKHGESDFESAQHSQAQEQLAEWFYTEQDTHPDTEVLQPSRAKEQLAERV